MNVKKCDRCGKYYDPYGGIEYNNKKVNVLRLARDGEQSVMCKDLCPECMESLIKWLEQEKVTPNEINHVGFFNRSYWLLIGDGTYCSECAQRSNLDRKTTLMMPACPHCGVRMNGHAFSPENKFGQNFKINNSKDSITINEYQQACLRFEPSDAKVSDLTRLEDGLMGLNGEAGEAIDILKKYLFQGHHLDKTHLAKELGDVAWYLAVSANAIGYDLETIFKMNIQKLEERYPDGFDPERSKHRKAGDI